MKSIHLAGKMKATQIAPAHAPVASTDLTSNKLQSAQKDVTKVEPVHPDITQKDGQQSRHEAGTVGLADVILITVSGLGNQDICGELEDEDDGNGGEEEGGVEEAGGFFVFARKVLCAFPPADGGFVFVDEGGFFVVVGHLWLLLRGGRQG